MKNNFGYVLIGASGHAKVVLDILESAGEKVLGLLELNPNMTKIFEYPVFNEKDFIFNDKHQFIIAIGDNRRRQVIASKLNVTFGLAKHQEATISNYSKIGLGSMVMAKAVLNPDSQVGEHCIINTACIVEHDCIIGDFVHVSPGAVVCGGVTIQDGAHIGAGAVVLPGLTIGSWATIGAGAIVTKSVPQGSIVVGNPGRII
ncbi:acetyltransferase [Roseivirga echinicomitans]